MAGRFEKEFAYTPIGTVEPNGQRVQSELINIFRYTDEGRLVEEWVQTDTCTQHPVLSPFHHNGTDPRLLAFACQPSGSISEDSRR
jgi:hypothetical protein